MKKNSFFIFFAFSILFANCRSGLVTMSNSCYTTIQQAQLANKQGNYSSALDMFNQVLQKCNAYDAKEKGYAGKAAALNGLQQYNDALEAATAGIKINNASLDNYFEKATAEFGLGMQADAKADLNTIVNLTQKNQNTAQRATIYEKMAEIDLKAKMYNDALNNINAAIALDATNTDFYMFRGDINVSQENFSDAVNDYELAISKGKDDAEAWKARTGAIIKSYQKKYNTIKTDELASRMPVTEKQSLCAEIRKAEAKGMKDMGADLIASAVCK